ncbi:MAG: protein kinase [Proteobacteria bacterium]|nr:protein kinase [Pseudomonadota bacterium]
MNHAATDPLVGTLFDHRYLINYLVARGGMGNIYQAHDTKRGHVVAIKVLRSEFSGDAVVIQRFLREAEAVALLKHKNICQLFDTGYTPDGMRYFTMEFLQGQSLDQIIIQRGMIDPATALGYTIQAASALCEAHNQGIIHRDLKPANLFVVQTPNAPDFVKVLDFGVAKMCGAEQIFEPKLTNAGSTLGTPYYMSPEQIQGLNVDGRTDVYALGVILWESLFGVPPYGGKSLVDIFSAAIRMKLPKLAPEYKSRPIYRKLYAVLKKALQKDRTHRYKSMQDFLRVLEKTSFEFGSAMSMSNVRHRTELVSHTPVSMPAFRRHWNHVMGILTPGRFIFGFGVLVLAVLAAVFIAVYVFPTHVEIPQTQYHTYKFFSDVPSEVRINNRIVGTTPSSIELVDAPPFEIVFATNLGETYSFMVDSVNDTIHGFAVNLAPKRTDTPKISVDTMPPGADVYVNGMKYPLTTPCHIDVTSHRDVLITIKLPGYITENILTAHQGGDIRLRSNLFRIRKP